MGVKYKFTAEDLTIIQRAKAKNKNKRIDKRLTVLEMSAQGVNRADIAHVTGYHIDYIPKLISQYRDGGIEAITGNHYHGNRRNMSVEEEVAILRPFQERARSGQLVDTREIKAAYEHAVGHKISSGQIYYVLKHFMTLENVLEIEDSNFEDSDLDVDLSIGNEPVDLMIADDPNESLEERKQRLDLICRNVIDGVIDINHLMIHDMIAVLLRMQEMVDELDQMILQAEQEGLELKPQIQQLRDENKRLRSYLQG